MTPKQLRRLILDQSKRANVGHIGSALSIVDIVIALFSTIRATKPQHAERDRFILSKGHAALAIYGVLRIKSLISADELDTYCSDGSLLGVHPSHCLPGIDFSTGSLGQGLTFACGAALSARMQKSGRKVYAIMSDAECNEGSVWEAAMFGAQHQLNNLYVVIDLNKQQAFGYTKDILSTDTLAQRWQQFGWNVIEVDGHNVDELQAALRENKHSKPNMIIAHTIFGKGVSYMENKIDWHYLPMSDEGYQEALAELEADQ